MEGVRREGEEEIYISIQDECECDLDLFATLVVHLIGVQTSKQQQTHTHTAHTAHTPHNQCAHTAHTTHTAQLTTSWSSEVSYKSHDHTNVPHAPTFAFRHVVQADLMPPPTVFNSFIGSS